MNTIKAFAGPLRPGSCISRQTRSPPSQEESISNLVCSVVDYLYDEHNENCENQTWPPAPSLIWSRPSEIAETGSIGLSLQKENQQLQKQVAQLECELHKLRSYVKKFQLGAIPSSSMSMWGPPDGATSGSVPNAVSLFESGCRSPQPAISIASSGTSSKFQFGSTKPLHEFETPPLAEPPSKAGNDQLTLLGLHPKCSGTFTNSFTPFSSDFSVPSASSATTVSAPPSASSGPGSSSSTTYKSLSSTYTSHYILDSFEGVRQFEKMPVNSKFHKGLTPTENQHQPYDISEMVRRILMSDDQKTSIELQRILCTGSDEIRSSVFTHLYCWIYQLTTSRFGNFVVQKCIEVGNKDQVSRVTHFLKGKVLELSMHQFACHVVQKALIHGDEERKAGIIEELLTQVRPSMLNKYGGHVWQRVFHVAADLAAGTEDSSTSLVKRVHRILRGQWLELAHSGTGSIVIQNLFERSDLEDKAPIMEELLSSFDDVIQNQFGYYVIQHILRNGPMPYRTRTIDLILAKASDYSIDMYASKVVESMVKLNDVKITDAYVNKVLTKDEVRQCVPMVDIASSQDGHYIIQHLVRHGTDAQFESLSTHLKKNAVFLRGSRWGSKCIWLLSQPRLKEVQAPDDGQQ